MQTYHGGSTVSRDGLALCNGTGRGASVIKREITRNRPFGSADRVRRLIEFSCHIEVVDCGLTTINSVEADQGVNLEVSEVEVNIYGVEATEEVD